jgi:hypothetical protein
MPLGMICVTLTLYRVVVIVGIYPKPAVEKEVICRLRLLIVVCCAKGRRMILYKKIFLKRGKLF